MPPCAEGLRLAAAPPGNRFYRLDHVADRLEQLSGFPFEVALVYGNMLIVLNERPDIRAVSF